jgi:6-phosphogluconolactonase
VIQNHLFQVLTNLAMEPPVRTDSESIRDEKVKLLKAIAPLEARNLVRGQFRGYRQEHGVHVGQVDERVVPAGHPDRNLTHLRESLLNHAPLRAGQVYAMPVEALNLEAAASQYAETLRVIAGSPPVFDLIHLGLGPDGHTASLVPDDPVLDVTDADVALTGVYQGKRRMTLTYPMINRSRRILWLVTGGDKVAMLRRLLDGDKSIPAGRMGQDRAVVIADSAAAGQLEAS